MESDKKNWGRFFSTEDAPQITRAMLEMKKPTPYTLEDRHKLEIQKVDAKPLISTLCPYTVSNVKLSDYIADAEAYLSELNMPKDVPDTVSENPVLDSMPENIPGKQSSVTKSVSHIPYGLNFEDVDQNLKQGVSLIAASKGFSLSYASALQTLTDATHQHLETLCNLLRATLDGEALTGQTGFYDCIDQVLHDMHIGSIHDLDTYYQKNIVQYHKKLKSASENLQAAIQDKNIKSLAKAKQEKVSRTGWMPVTNISAATSESATSFNSRWKPFVKTEPPTIPQQTALPPNIYPNIKSQDSTNISSSSDYWPSQKRFCP